MKRKSFFNKYFLGHLICCFSQVSLVYIQTLTSDFVKKISLLMMNHEKISHLIVMIFPSYYEAGKVIRHYSGTKWFMGTT